MLCTLPDYEALEHDGELQRFRATDPRQKPIAWIGIALYRRGRKQGHHDDVNRVRAIRETLVATRFPLHGSRLIEASAGTGKTFTIAALYLRLVLGHGDAQAFPRPLGPSEILVMTFTRAATRELSDRIRKRLIEAARCFRRRVKTAG